MGGKNGEGSMQRCLMLGAGHKKPCRKLMAPTSVSEEETEWTTLDYYVPADIKYNLWDLCLTDPLLPSGEFDEIHAYEVLEHFGQQGNVEHFFNTFNNLWKMLKRGGKIIASTPGCWGIWVWSDPGHTRVIAPSTLLFLTREHYKELGSTTSSDYRSLVDPYWWEIEFVDEKENAFFFCLRKAT